ncbi:cofactor-independent phosphoglycerate mutase [Methanomicrobium antiquum]|uniref:phosphoglycerate mutase (2,3-diphosphoglycerate-independent) n=1 Tax=Methanomicrobium antiquum TaxID=487686 RepID=A0AAF0FRG1_9EURY|nr:cofactor-independent phosphoglycerate mutase [Methanomicrobium antiquum]MDD3977819.1 cofactor-independent phosphoglycerate mutase [Methanomicrobium sp.]WFN36646.1 cofactor-independent phosphoglycerate mutase [Methanomicrobium antiquum]
MKYILILGDGMADWPVDELGGKTPLEYAKTPNFDRIAKEGKCGMLKTVPDSCEPGSDVANLGVLGYNAEECYTGRGPLEAVSMGIDLKEGAFAYRCNIVAVKDGIMADFTAGHISSEESAQLFKTLNEYLPESVKAYSGISYRNLLVLKNAKGSITKAPHDIVGQNISENLPTGDDSEILLKCVEISREVFKDHPVNKKRIADGKTPATEIWPWSGGKKPSIESFREKYGLSGGIISAVDLLNGIAKCAEMKVIKVPGATGYLDTDYEAKAEYAVKALTEEDIDFVYMHVEAPDEAGHLGSIKEKVLAIERLDEVSGRFFEIEDLMIAVLPDHPTPVAFKTHTKDPVPFAIRGRGVDECSVYSEKEAEEKGGFKTIDAKDFLNIFFGLKSA